MPCYTINKTSIAINAKFRDLLHRAIKNFAGDYNSDCFQIKEINGKLELEISGRYYYNPVEYRNKIQVEYSKLVIEELAKKRKWLLRKSKQNSLKMKLVRY